MNGELFGIGRTWWFGVAIILGVTVLTAIGEINFGQWWEVTRWIASIVIGGKTIEKVGDAIGKRRQK